MPVVLGAVVLAPLIAHAPPAQAANTAGVCLMQLTVTYTPPIPPVPGLPVTNQVTIAGSGTCFTVDDPMGTPGNLSGTAQTPLGLPLITCAGGVAVGTTTASFNLTMHPATAASNATLVVAIEAGIAEVALTSTPQRFVGGGVFVQDPVATALCPTTGLVSTTWCGAFAFAQASTIPVVDDG